MLNRIAVAAALIMAATAAHAADKPTLTISVYGISQDAYKKDLYAPFEARCGCNLVVETGNSEERLAKLEARKADPVIDVAALADYDALTAAQKGLVQPIDVAKLSNYGQLYDFAKDPVGGHRAVGYTFYGTSIVYRTDKVKIASWKDLFQDKLKGRIALPNITTTQGPLLLYMVNRALGGTAPDFSPAIDRVAADKAGIVTFYTQSAVIPQLFEQDEIWAAVIGRFGWANLNKLKMPIAWATPSEGQTGGMNVLTLVKGAKHEALALQFIDYWLSAEVQTRLAMGLIDSPANRTVTVPPNIADGITYGAETAASLRFLPPDMLLKNRSAWLAAWNAKVAR